MHHCCQSIQTFAVSCSVPCQSTKNPYETRKIETGDECTACTSSVQNICVSDMNEFCTAGLHLPPSKTNSKSTYLFGCFHNFISHISFELCQMSDQFFFSLCHDMVIQVMKCTTVRVSNVKRQPCQKPKTDAVHCLTCGCFSSMKGTRPTLTQVV